MNDWGIELVIAAKLADYFMGRVWCAMDWIYVHGERAIAFEFQKKSFFLCASVYICFCMCVHMYVFCSLWRVMWRFDNVCLSDGWEGGAQLVWIFHVSVLTWYMWFGMQLLAVKKLDKGISSRLKDHEFLELVNDIDRIRHVNVVELVGYCSEHSQRLLIYEYCSNGTLQESLHSDDEYRKKLSWNMRIQMTLGTARALE